MANETTTTVTATDVKGKKASDRKYLDADLKTEAESPIGCAGFSYKSMPEGWEKSFEWSDFNNGQAVSIPPIVAGFAAFGALTLVGNQTNRVRNGQVKDGGPSTELEAVEQWLENVKAGNWVTAGGEVEAGSAKLAEAHLRLLQAAGTVTAKDGTAIDLDYVKASHKAKTKEERKALRADSRIKVEMAKIDLERAQAKAGATPADAAPLGL